MSAADVRWCYGTWYSLKLNASLVIIIVYTKTEIGEECVKLDEDLAIATLKSLSVTNCRGCKRPTPSGVSFFHQQNDSLSHLLNN